MNELLTSIRDPNSLSAPVTIILVCNILGVALKKSPLANWMIPFILLGVGTISYFFIGDPNAVYPAVSKGKMVVWGFLYAGGAVYGHQLLNNWIDRPKKKDGDTTFIERDKHP